MAEINNITLKSLKRTHPEQASELFEKIRRIGGFGDVDPNHEGGLDIKGLPEGKQEQIAELLAKAEEKEAELKAKAEEKAAEANPAVDTEAKADKRPADKAKK